MKVVLFCGGLGMRMREYSETIPKPMVPIGYRPIMWHLMRYYAHFGHKDFILCLGYRGDVIKDYFLDYNEWLSNDFVLSERRRRASSCCDATSTTGASRSSTPGTHSNIGERLLAVRPHLEGEEVFLANYSRRADRRAAADRHDRLLPRAAASIACFVSARAQPQLPRRVASTMTAWSTAIEAVSRRGHLDQRRLLRAEPRDLRLHAAGRGAGRASRSSA